MIKTSLIIIVFVAITISNVKCVLSIKLTVEHSYDIVERKVTKKSSLENFDKFLL
jgi:hypothetical protein